MDTLDKITLIIDSTNSFLQATNEYLTREAEERRQLEERAIEEERRRYVEYVTSYFEHYDI